VPQNKVKIKRSNGKGTYNQVYREYKSEITNTTVDYKMFFSTKSATV